MLKGVRRDGGEGLLVFSGGAVKGGSGKRGGRTEGGGYLVCTSSRKDGCVCGLCEADF